MLFQHRKLNFLIVVVLLVVNSSPLSNSLEQSNNKRIVNDNNEIKHLINNNKFLIDSCPIEYKSCKCNYETLSSNNYSIIINCQHHYHHNQHIVDFATKKPIQHENLSIIKKINLTNYQYASSIYYLDLSRTLIKEIPSGAFHV